jgi:hypothetical protein
MPNASTIDEMAGFLVRWTDKDVETDVPRRLKAALARSGGERAPLARSLLIQWLELVEKRGPGDVTRAAGRIAEHPEKAYGPREKRETRKKRK